MRAYRAFFSLLFIMGLSVSAFGQKNYARKGENEFYNERFTLAIDEFKKAYDKVPEIKNPRKRAEKAHYAYRIGQAYLMMTDAANAQVWFEKAILLRAYEADPEVYYWMYYSLHEQGKNEQARENINKFKELAPADSRIAPSIRALTISDSIKATKTKHVIENLQRLNTEFYEFAPVIASKKADELIFSSSRPGGETSETDYRTGHSYMNVWISAIDKKGHFSQPQLVEGINSEMNEGALCFDRRFKTMFFTRCSRLEKYNLGCDIYFVEKQGTSWGEPEKMNLKNHDSVSVGHPALTEDGMVLVFASNMEGGYGGRDLWLTRYDKKEKQWSIPENLGKDINTAGDEMFPTFGLGDKLYFASDGHPGLGGLDMFSTTKVSEEEYAWKDPVNLGFPMNSERNDFGIVFEDEEMTKGYFTSNRMGSKGGHIDDIYRFHLPPIIFRVTVQVTNAKTGNPVPDAALSLIGTDGSNVEVLTDENGQFYFDKKTDDERYINKNTTYNIGVRKDEFFANSDVVTTVNLDQSYDFFREILLLPLVKDSIYDMPEVRYDYDQYTLQLNDSVNSKDSLNYLYDIMTKNPSFIVKLRSHTDCRGSDKYNQKLSENRAKECVKYLVEEKGIHPDRLIAVGMGEYEPRIYTYNNENGEEISQELTCDYVNKQKTVAVQEQLHQRNRRTDFQVVGFDFVPPDEPENEEGDDEGGDNEEGEQEEE